MLLNLEDTDPTKTDDFPPISHTLFDTVQREHTALGSLACPVKVVPPCTQVSSC